MFDIHAYKVLLNFVLVTQTSVKVWQKSIGRN